MKRLTAGALALAMPLGAGAAPSASLDEILVTATRQPDALLAYPGSAARLEAAELALLGATHVAEALNRTAGAMLQRGSGQESLTALRSPVLTGAGSCGAFLFLEDGIPLRPVGFCNVNELFDVNSEQAAAIEVLRGTGSALYGSNAVHGIINVVPPLPGELPRFGLALEAGENGYLRGRVAGRAATPAGDLGLALHATSDAGWRDQSGFDEQKLSLATVRPWREGVLTLRLNASNLAQETAGFIAGQDAYRDPALARSNPNPEAFRDSWSGRLQARWQQSTAAGGLDLRAYARASRMEFLQHFLLGKPLERNGQQSLGVQLQRLWQDGESRTIAGFDAELASGFLLEDQEGPTLDGSPAQRAIRPAGRHYDYDVRQDMAAAYVHREQPLGGPWSLTAGLRAETVGYRYDNRMLDGNTDENGVPCGAGGCLYSRPADRDDRYTNFGPRLALGYRLSATDAAWLGLAGGFRPPETTELYRLQRQQSVAPLDSERIVTAELGWRHAGPKLQGSLAAYLMDKRDVIFRDSDGANVDAGRTRHAGLEFEARWQPAGGWRFEAAGTYAVHQYRFTRVVDQGESIAAGNDIDTAPRRLHAVRAGWQSSHADIELEWQRVGAYWANAANTASYPGHDLLNLRASWLGPAATRMTIRVTNLLDRAYADRADYAFGSYRYFPGRGRALFAEFAWQRD